MSKITIEKNLFCLPWTQTLLGSLVNGKANFMALDRLARVNYQPAMPDNRFWTVGEHVGHAWKNGVQYKEKISGKQAPIDN